MASPIYRAAVSKARTTRVRAPKEIPEAAGAPGAIRLVGALLWGLLVCVLVAFLGSICVGMLSGALDLTGDRLKVALALTNYAAVLVGGIAYGTKTGARGLLGGAIIGGSYVAVCFFVARGYLGIQASARTLASQVGISITLGAAGGMLGVNLRS